MRRPQPKAPKPTARQLGNNEAAKCYRCFCSFCVGEGKLDLMDYECETSYKARPIDVQYHSEEVFTCPATRRLQLGLARAHGQMLSLFVLTV